MPFQASNLGCATAVLGPLHSTGGSAASKNTKKLHQKMQFFSCVEKKESEFGILCIIHQIATTPAMKTSPEPSVGNTASPASFYPAEILS